MKNFKGIFRKVTVMVVMLSLVCQLIPLGVSAGEDALVPDMKTEENVSVISKTAERIAGDEWEVTLSVEALQDLYTKPLELVVLYDISGSMAWCTQEEHSHSFACRRNGCDKEEHRHSALAGRMCKGTTVEDTRQYILGTALRDFVTELNGAVDGAKVSVCTFGNRGYTDVPLTELNDSTVDMFCDNIPVQYQRRAELTNLRLGILNAQKQFTDNPNTTKLMLIVCDGEYTGTLPVVAANNLKADGVIIDCVGFLYSSDVLSEIATEGHYHYAESGIQLETFMGTYLDSTSAMITDVMGDAVKFGEFTNVSGGECIVSDDRSTWTWIPEGGVLRKGETAEISYTVKLKYEYNVSGEHDIALNNSAVLDCVTADGTHYSVDFPVPVAHYEIGSITITVEGLPSDISPSIVYYDKKITDFTEEEFKFNVTAPEFVGADGTKYYYLESVYTDKDGNTSAFDGLTTTSIPAVSGDQTIVHYYTTEPVACEFVVSYIYGGAVPFGADPLPLPKAYKVGETVVIADEPAEVPGYDFLGWVAIGVDEADGQFEMPANHVVVKGVWAKEITPPAIKYSVSYIYTGVVPFGAPLPPAVEFYDQFTPDIAVKEVPVMDDYVFVGWFTLTAFVVDGEFTMPMNHVVFYGHWVPKAQYKVEYEYIGDVPAGADALPEDAWYKANESVTVAPAPADVEGYTFTGWYSADASIGSGVFAMPRKCVKIVGKWVKDEEPAEKYAVKYEYAGDVPANADALPGTAMYEAGTRVTVAPTPADVDGYTFLGWATADANITTGSFAMPSANVTIKGVWVKDDVPPTQYNVTYVYTGDVPADADELPASASYAAGVNVVVADAPSAVEGYTFLGWYSDDVNIAAGAFAMPESDVVIEGRWIKNEEVPTLYTVTYEYEGEIPAGADALPAVEVYAAGIRVVLKNIPGAVDGYTFTGWYTDDAVIADGAFAMPEGDVVIKGKWTKDVVIPDPEPEKYTVTYEYEGEVPEDADALPADAQYEAGANVSVAPNPADVDGYTFSGWYTNDAIVADGAFAMPEGDVVVKGKWTKNAVTPDPEPEKYNVTYKYEGEVPEGADALPADAQYEAGATVDFAALPADVEGYIFTGWMINGEVVSAVSFTMPEADVEIVGVWEKIPEDVQTYSVTYQDGVEDVEITVPAGKDGIPGGADYTISSDVPVYEGFTFNGWISSVDGKLYNPGDTVTVDSDIVFVASWSENPKTADAFLPIVIITLCACAVMIFTNKRRVTR